MSVIVEFSLAPEHLSFAPTLSTAPSVELDIEQEYAHSALPVVFCWVRGEDLDTFEEALADDGTVADIEQFAESGDRRLYRARLTGAAPVVTYDAWIELGAARLDMHYADDRWHTRMRFPDRVALSEFRDFCDAHVLEFRLTKLYHADPERGPAQDRPTTCQRETLRLAHERGYFEIPREATLADLANELDVSDQAVSERLRRGCGQLVGDLHR